MAVENRYEFLKKLGVGFDQLFDVVDGLGTAYFTEDYPPYNIVKTDGETIVIQVSMTGYDRSHVTAAHQKNVLTVKAKAQTKTPDEADDVYFHHGIKDGDNYIKFPIASHLRFEGSIFDNGVLYLTYKERKDGEPAMIDGPVEIKDSLDAKEDDLFRILPDSGKVKFDRSGRALLRRQRMGFRRYMYDPAGRPIGVMDLENPEKLDEEETEQLLKARGKEKNQAKKEAQNLKKEADKAAAIKARVEKKAKEEIEKETAKVEPAKPVVPSGPAAEVTVEVSAPENKPQIVEAVVEKKADDKVEIELKDATLEVSDDVVLTPVKTPDGKADIVVAVKKEEQPILDEAKIDIVETVKEVVDALDSAPKLPEKTEKAEEKKTVLVDKENKDKPTVEVTVPKEIPSVVEVKKDEKPSKPDVPAIVVEDAGGEIKEDAELIPVVTPAGQPDVVVAIEPAVKEELEAAGVEVEAVVEKAIGKAVEEVKTAEPVDEKELEVASDDPIVVAVEEKVAEETVEIVNKDEPMKSPVEVKNDVEEPVAIVEVKLDEENTDPVVAEVMPVVIEDASVEVSDDAELVVVKTDEGHADVIVAATPEVREELAKANTTPEEVVAEVVEAPELPEETKVVVEDPETKEEVEVQPEPITVIVDKTVDEKPTVEVTVPDVVSQVVVAEVKEPEVAKDAAVAVELKDTVEDIPVEAAVMPVVTPEGQPDMVVVVPPEAVKDVTTDELVEAVEKAINQADVIVDAPVVDTEKVDEASVVEEVVEKLEEIAKEPATIVVDKEVDDRPTVEVTLAAEESPQVVEVKLDEKPSDPAIPAIVVEDATVEVSDTAELIVAKTEPDKADVVIAIEPETKELLEKADIVIEDVVKDALEINDAVPEIPDVEAVIVEEKVLEKVEEKMADPDVIESNKDKPAEEVIEELKAEVLPEVEAEVKAEPVEEVTVLVDKAVEEKPTVEVSTPEVIPQVVEAVLDPEPAKADVVSVDLVEVKEDIPVEAELVPVVTPENQPDIIVAVNPEVKAELEKVNADVSEVLEKAVNIADVEVVTTESTTVDPVVVEEAAAVEVVAEKLEEIAKEPATILVDDAVDEKPTVEVTLAAEEAPQIVEVTIDPEPATDAPAIVVEDATVEVKSDTAELIPVTTEEGKSDVVIAIEPEVKAELEAKDVVVEEVVAKALEINDAVPEIPVETALAPVETVEIKSEVNPDKTLTVEVPEVISQIVEVEKEGDKIVLNDTSAEILPEAELAVVETPAGEADIVIAVEPVVAAELADEGLEAEKVVAEAIAEVAATVETVVETSETPVVEAAPVADKKPVVVVKKPK